MTTIENYRGRIPTGLLTLLGVGLLVAAIGYAFYQLGAGTRLAQALHLRYDSPVLFYSASWCGVCDRTRQHLRANRIPYVELDIEKDGAAAQQFAQFGGHGVPLLLVRGQVLRGFDPARIRRSLAED